MSVSVMQEAHGVQDSEKFCNYQDSYTHFPVEPTDPIDVATKWLVLPRNILRVDIERTTRLSMTDDESAAYSTVLEDEQRQTSATRLLQIGLAVLSVANMPADMQKCVDLTWERRHRSRIINGISQYDYTPLGKGLVSLGMATHFITSTAEPEPSAILELECIPRRPPSFSVHSASVYTSDSPSGLEVTHSHLYMPDTVAAGDTGAAYITKSEHLTVGIDTSKTSEVTLWIRKGQIIYGLDAPDLDKPAVIRKVVPDYATLFRPYEFAKPVLWHFCGFENLS